MIGTFQCMLLYIMMPTSYLRRFLAEKKLYFLFLLYIAIIAPMIAQHAVWRDEGNVWVVLRDAPLTQLIHYYDGHPPLWFVVNFPLARLGFNVSAMQWLNGFFAAGFAWLLLFRAPFPLWIRAGLLLCVPFGYQYSVVARGYGLMTMLWFCLAALYPHRLKHPLWMGLVIGLLFNSELFAVVPALIILGYFIYDAHTSLTWRQWIPACAISGLLGFIALLALIPPSLINMGLYKQNNPQAFAEHVSNAFVQHHDEAIAWYQNHIDTPAIQSILETLNDLQAPLAWIAIVAIFIAILPSWRISLFWAAWLGWFYYITTYRYAGTDHHSGLIFIMMVATLWLNRYETAAAKPAALLHNRFIKGSAHALIALVIASNIAAITALYISENEEPYSGSKAMGKFIDSHALQNESFLMVGCSRLNAVAAYLGTAHLWHAALQHEGAYVIPDRSQGTCHLITAEQFTALIYQSSAQFNAHYIMSDRPLSLPHITLLEQTQGQMEDFWLYATP